MQLAANQLIVTDLVRFIIEQVERMIYFNTLIKKNLTQYCYTQSIKYTHDTFNELYRNPQQRQDNYIQKQPKALIQDNFFPAALVHSIKLVQRNNKSEQKKEVKIEQGSQSQISHPKKSHKQEQNSPCEQLKLFIPEQQQNILKELRRQRLDQDSKQNQKKKKNEQRPQKTQGKEKKQQKLSYDYNGQIIKVKSQNKKSLVSGGLNGQTLQTFEKTKQVKINPSATIIQFQTKDKRFFKFGKNNQIQFTNTRSLLSQARITTGTKFIQDGIIVQQKHKPTSAKQLMKTLSGRKLTKQEYKKIKQISGNIIKYDDLSGIGKTINQIKSQVQENLSQFRSASQSKLSNSILTRRKSTITVSDPQLLQNLISGIQSQGNHKITRSNIKNQQEKQQNKIDSNDYYNLQYIKKGGSVHSIKKSKSIADLADMKLPKIQASKLQMPRVRQRLKDKQQIVRTIRKKFEQKLRT